MCVGIQNFNTQAYFCRILYRLTLECGGTFWIGSEERSRDSDTSRKR